MKNWTLAKVWNESIAKRTERPVEPRNRIYASELGRSDVDIFLKLKGEVPSNPPNERSFRKFAAGDAFEWFVRLVLVRSGIYIASQTPVKTTLPNCLEVSGKLDFIAGGVPRYSEAQEEIDRLIALLELPDVFHQISTNIIEYFKANYPEGLDEKILEVKSVATYGFEKIEKTNKSLSGHDLQNFHYANGLQKEGAICYICRDDLRMYEIPILPNDQRLLARYKEKVERISQYYADDIQPEIEPVLVFDEDMGRFSKNFNVEYSAFLTKLYGFERPDLYDEKYSPLIERWNRVLGRIKEGKDMTDNNAQALVELTEHGFDVEYIKSKLKINTK